MEINKKIGNLFKESRKKENYSLEDVQYLLKKECGIDLDVSNISRYENGAIKNMNPKYVRSFCKIYKLDFVKIFKELDFLIESDFKDEKIKNNKKDNIIEQLKDPIKMMSVPVYSSVAAGLGFIPDAEPIEHILIPELSGDCIGARVSGDSMEPTFYNGDIVIFKKDIEVGLGEIGIFQNKNTGEALVKRLKKKNGVYVLESDNHIFPDIEIKSNEIVCCGKVVNVVKKDLKKRSNPLIEKIESLDPKQQEIIEMMINGLLEKKWKL